MNMVHRLGWFIFLFNFLLTNRIEPTRAYSDWFGWGIEFIIKKIKKEN